MWRHHRGPEDLRGPFYVSVIFKPVESAGGINHYSAGAKRGPNFLEYSPLPFYAELDILRGPLLHGLGFLPEHPFTGAGDICDDDVIALSAPPVNGGVQRRYSNPGITPDPDIGAEYVEAGAYGLICREGKVVSGERAER